MDRLMEAEKREYLRAGLIAATIVNVNRRKGQRLVQPGDFIRERIKPDDFMSVEEATAKMDGWAKTLNKDLQAQQSFEVDGLITGGGLE